MKNPFDELAKTLAIAKEVPRRDALRLIGGGLAGGVLAAFGVGKALGQGKGNLGNSPCAHFCVATFPPGPARGECISDAAHGEGLCFECGPAAPEGHPPLCGQVCCETDAVCCDGTCCEPTAVCCDGTCCAVGEVCEAGACVTPVCGVITGGCGNSTVCGSNEVPGLGLCLCFETTEGVGPCTSDFFCAGAQACTSTADCPTGEVCTTNTCCGVDLCAPACNGTAALRLGEGPTASGAIR